MVKGRYAQLTNRAERREAMAITAAELLHHFVGFFFVNGLRECVCG